MNRSRAVRDARREALEAPTGAAMASAAGQAPPLPYIPAEYHPLLRLPPAFWYRMSRYLHYTEILQLSQLSSQFYDVRLEYYLPRGVRYMAVQPLDTEPAALTRRRACYICFRMKDVDEFERVISMASHAYVRARDAYTGQRILERTEPSPGQEHNIFGPPQSPPLPAAFPSPVLMPPPPTVPQPAAIGYVNDSPVAIRADVDFVPQRPPLPNLPPPNLPPQGAPPLPVLPPPNHSQSSSPYELPGAEVGQVEQLGRYCIECALATHLSVPGDVIVTNSGATRLWVCHCRQALLQDTGRCPICNMAPVYRD